MIAEDFFNPSADDGACSAATNRHGDHRVAGALFPHRRRKEARMIGYFQNEDGMYQCEGCDKEWPAEFSTWQHICNQPKCHQLPLVKQAVDEYELQQFQRKHKSYQ